MFANFVCLIMQEQCQLPGHLKAMDLDRNNLFIHHKVINKQLFR